jgi:hypothetical protein
MSQPDDKIVRKVVVSQFVIPLKKQYIATLEGMEAISIDRFST